MTPNVELLDRVLDHIRMNPQEWDQKDWARETDCGTVACFAGTAVLMTGGSVVCSKGWAKDTAGYSDFRRADGTVIEWVDVYAAGLLGLDPKRASVLFHTDNSFDDLERIVKDIKNGE